MSTTFWRTYRWSLVWTLGIQLAVEGWRSGPHGCVSLPSLLAVVTTAPVVVFLVTGVLWRFEQGWQTWRTKETA